MHVHDTVTHNVALSSDSHLALTCWEMAHTLIILLCGLSNLPFLRICLSGYFPFVAVERETRKGVYCTRVCSDFCAGWLVPLGIRGLISLKWNIPSLMCSVWHISASGCLGDNWEVRWVLNTVSGWRSLSSETSIKGVKEYWLLLLFLLFLLFLLLNLPLLFFPFPHSSSSLEIGSHYIVQADPNVTPLLRYTWNWIYNDPPALAYKIVESKARDTCSVKKQNLAK